MRLTITPPTLLITLTQGVGRKKNKLDDLEPRGLAFPEEEFPKCGMGFGTPPYLVGRKKKNTYLGVRWPECNPP